MASTTILEEEKRQESVPSVAQSSPDVQVLAQDKPIAEAPRAERKTPALSDTSEKASSIVEQQPAAQDDMLPIEIITEEKQEPLIKNNCLGCCVSCFGCCCICIGGTIAGIVCLPCTIVTKVFGLDKKETQDETSQGQVKITVEK